MGGGASTLAESILDDSKMLEALYEIRPELKDLSKVDLLTSLHGDLILAKEVKSNMPNGFKLEEVMNNMAPTVKGLVSKVGHICRVVRDSEKSMQFYTNIIGANLLNRPNFPTNGYWLWLGNLQLHLIESDLSIAPDHPEGGTRVNHISFDCYDFDAVVERLKIAGIKYNRVFVPLGDGQGINQVFFQDPDLHWIEMCDCQRFNDFIYGEYDTDRAEQLRKAYLEGIEPKGTFIGSLVFMLMAQNGIKGTKSPLVELFNKYSGGDGVLSLDDLGTILSRFAGKPDAADKAAITTMLKKMDHDSDSGVTLEEFHKYLTIEVLDFPDQAELLEVVFSALDKNQSGSITATEFSENMKCIDPLLTDDKITELFTSVDKNNDRVVTKDEFGIIFDAFKKEIGAKFVKE